MNRSLSRREFVTLAATGTAAAIGFDVSSSIAGLEVLAQEPVLQGLPRVDGQLLVDSASRRAIAIDNSNVFHRVPAAVLRPRSARDVVEIVQYANERSLK